MVPLDFGFDGEFLYFHCAREGRKLDLLRKNPNISLLFVDYGGVFTSEKDNTACSYSTRFASVMASGKAVILEDPDRKRRGLAALMEKIGKQGLPLREGMLDLVCVVKVELFDLVGKKSPVSPPKNNA
jgi:nitroimidazol reductase NimA-like FMN-containing flavoprotein (pyridoxamine 5'-phosphate oxidase superfamily)